MILYFRFWFYVLKAYFKPQLPHCGLSRVRFRVLPWDCASKTMNNARFYSFMDIAQHENNVRTRFLSAAVREHWRVVIRNARITFYKPLQIFEKFDVTSQVVCWDDRYFYWKNEFLNLKGEVVARAYGAVAVRNRRKRIAVRPAEVIEKLRANVQPSISVEEMQRLCSDSL